MEASVATCFDSAHPTYLETICVLSYVAQIWVVLGNTTQSVVTVTRSEITKEWITPENASWQLASRHLLQRKSILLKEIILWQYHGWQEEESWMILISLRCDGSVMSGLHPGLWPSDMDWHMDDKYETNMTTEMTAEQVRSMGILRGYSHISLATLTGIVKPWPQTL